MKICAVICEFNPFHNGHAYLLNRARELTGCDAAVCIMSGSFTQRGEMCRLDKYDRARCAILGGADCVTELPVSFAVAPAEVFAEGAVACLGNIDGDVTLAFGCEHGDRDDFIAAADIALGESEKFKSVLSQRLARGDSYIRGYAAAFEACGGKPGLLSSPNDVLGVEYVKAIKKRGLKFDIAPIRRVGCGYNETGMRDGFMSASGIRADEADPNVKLAMPGYSYSLLASVPDNAERFKRLAADLLFLCDRERLKCIYGCTEGLENRLKALADGGDFDGIVDAAAGKRYSKARIRRILTCNMLGLFAEDARRFLRGVPPLNVLAVRESVKDGILPIIARRTGGDAEECLRLTSSAYALWRHLNAPLHTDNPDEKMIFVK